MTIWQLIYSLVTADQELYSQAGAPVEVKIGSLRYQIESVKPGTELPAHIEIEISDKPLPS